MTDQARARHSCAPPPILPVDADDDGPQIEASPSTITTRCSSASCPADGDQTIILSIRSAAAKRERKTSTSVVVYFFLATTAASGFFVFFFSAKYHTKKERKEETCGRRPPALRRRHHREPVTFDVQSSRPRIYITHSRCVCAAYYISSPYDPTYHLHSSLSISKCGSLVLGSFPYHSLVGIALRVVFFFVHTSPVSQVIISISFIWHKCVQTRGSLITSLRDSEGCFLFRA